MEPTSANGSPTASNTEVAWDLATLTEDERNARFLMATVGSAGRMVQRPGVQGARCAKVLVTCRGSRRIFSA